MTSKPKRDWRNFYQSEDAVPHWDYDSGFPLHGEFIRIEDANALLRKAIEEESLQVYRLKNGLIVSPNPVPGVEITYSGPVAITHKARLICIEELAREGEE